MTDRMESDAKLRLFLEILSAANGQASGNDEPWNWINYFCDDAEPLDTFNQASKRKFTRVGHDGFDNSEVTLTDAGRAFIATPPAAAQSNGDADIDKIRSVCKLLVEAYQRSLKQPDEVTTLRTQLEATRKALEEIKSIYPNHTTGYVIADKALAALTIGYQSA